MNLKNKKSGPGVFNTIIIALLLLIFIYNTTTANFVFATSSAPGTGVSSETASSNESTQITDGSGGLGVTYRKGMVSAGLYHTVLLNADGQVYCWGDNSYGQLGIGSTENEESPVLVPDLVNIIMVKAGAYHTMALSQDGIVYVWGRNTFGQIGNGTSIASLKPVRIDSIPPVNEIAAGAFHSMALTIDGKVYAWGNNNDFQVGDVLAENIADEAGNTLGKRVVTPQLIVESDVKAISAGGNHSLYLKNDGRVYAWGSNKYGQLGDGSQVSRGLPTEVYGLTMITKISAGYSHNLALKEVPPVAGVNQDTYQNLYVWGSDSDGQLGLGSAFDETRYVDRPTRVDTTNDSNEKNDQISYIQAGYSNSAITVPVIKNGKYFESVYIWGNNTYGQLGVGDLPSQNVPVVLIATSNGWTGSVFLPFQSIAIGGYHTVFLSVKGFVGTVGRANKGQLGNVSIIDSKIPIGIAVPDAIAPGWTPDDKIQVTDQVGSILVKWPQAKDNIKVTGYQLSYLSTSKEIKNITLGTETQDIITDLDKSSLEIITVNALDANGNVSETSLEYEYGSTFGQSSSSESSSMPDSSQSGIDVSNFEEYTEIDSSITSVSDGMGGISSSETAISEETSSSEPGITDEIPEITPPVVNPLVWSPGLYGTIIPLEVPWNVDYVYGAGVVAPPRDYSWIITVFVTIAIVLFFLFLGVVSFRKKHKGQRLFKGVFNDIFKKRRKTNEPEKIEQTADIVQIGDGIDLVQDEDYNSKTELETEDMDKYEELEGLIKIKDKDSHFTNKKYKKGKKHNH